MPNLVQTLLRRHQLESIGEHKSLGERVNFVKDECILKTRFIDYLDYLPHTLDISWHLCSNDTGVLVLEE